MSGWIVETDGRNIKIERKLDLKKGKLRMVIKEEILWMYSDEYGGYYIEIMIYNESGFPIEIKRFYEVFPKELDFSSLEGRLDEKTQAVILEIAEKYGFRKEAEDFLVNSYSLRGLEVLREALSEEQFGLLIDRMLRALYL